MKSLFSLLVMATLCHEAMCWVPATSSRRGSTLNMNFLSDVGDFLTGGKLVPQTSIPYDPPLSGCSIGGDTRTFAIQERAISFTGEDFDVFDAESGGPYLTVRGAMLHLPGKDKMRIKVADGDEVAVLDRKLVAMTPTYDLYRGGMGAEKIGWIEKELVSLTETFDVYMEGKGGIGPFKPPPAYRIEGDFIERNFVMKNTNNEVVAKISKDRIIEFDAFNHYQVQVAEGMDAVLVLACACAIDEEFDEEHKAKKEKEE
mmetsp:Transcript_26776/g.37757  ORF Transcript_26776/g.37757 Transcript_26776/m.37757 type:complete len:258 (-) Transcript_26776:1105-1878(-)